MRVCVHELIGRSVVMICEPLSTSGGSGIGRGSGHQQHIGGELYEQAPLQHPEYDGDELMLRALGEDAQVLLEVARPREPRHHLCQHMRREALGKCRTVLARHRRTRVDGEHWRRR